MRGTLSVICAAALALLGLPVGAQGPDPTLWVQLSSASDNSDPAYPGWTALWQAQPTLMQQGLDALAPAEMGRPNGYVLSIAAGGAQQLFSREATLAADSLAAYFGEASSHALILSNGGPDLQRYPMATVTSLEIATLGMATRMMAARDVAIVYLAAHGAQDASLATDLPTYQALRPITAKALAAALDRAGIRRRIVIVSACFSGTWIPALKSDDSIIITAASADRTSFGCDDQRELTFFGEAFLKRALRPGVPLEQVFESAKAAILEWETKEQFTPSKPQAYVGRNMKALWTKAPDRR